MKKKYLILIIVGWFCTTEVNAKNLDKIRIMDLHSHIILPEYVSFLKKHNAELEEYFPLPPWSIEKHLMFMETMGIGTAILSLPAPQPFFDNVEESRKIIRKLNEEMAKIKTQYLGKFMFCATLPLPNVNAAVKEAIYTLDRLKADCIKLASNSRGQYLGDEALDPLMEVLSKRNAVVIIHPHRPTPYSQKNVSTVPLAIYEYSSETTRAVINMVARNVLARYPDMKVVVPHTGSFLPLAIPRMKAVHPVMAAKGLMAPIDWEANFSRLYYDLAGTPTAEQLRMLLAIAPPDHIMYGSDFPYVPDTALKKGLSTMKTYLRETPEFAPHAEKILRNNAAGLFIKNKT